MTEKDVVKKDRTFDAVSFLQQGTKAVRSTKIYTDAASLSELDALVEDAESITPAQQKKIKALVAKIEKTALTFTLESLSAGEMRMVFGMNLDNEAQMTNFISRMLVSIADADGNKDVGPFTIDYVDSIRSAISLQGDHALQEVVNELSGVTFAVDKAIDAGFFQKS